MSSDPKLAFLVKRCVKSGVTDAEDICRQICDEHMEYRRKPQVCVLWMLMCALFIVCCMCLCG